MATPNYSYEKRQRELAKKRKAEEKRQRKLNGKSDEAAAPDEPPGRRRSPCRPRQSRRTANLESAAQSVSPSLPRPCPASFCHHSPALCERRFPHRPHHGVHPGRHLGSLPTHGGLAGALRLRGRRPRRPHHDRGREGPEDAAGIRRWHRGRPQAIPDGFHISFDNWHSTDGAENHELSKAVYLALRHNELISTKTIEQFFDPAKSMFLPDRFIKGECPKCGAKDQYGDSCEVCRRRLRAHGAEESLLGAVGRDAGAQEQRALLLQVERPALRRLPDSMDQGRRSPAARGAKQDPRMVRARRGGQQPSSATGTSAATRPISASRSPMRRASTSMCGWTPPSATSPR